MTDVSNLDDLANAISQSGSPKVRAYAQAQAAATQSQEAAIRALEAKAHTHDPDPPPPPPVAKPSIPTGLAGTVGDTRVTLVWNANPASENVDGYQVYVNDVMTVPDVDALGYVVTGLANGTAYTFRVSAHNTAGTGDWTASVTVTPQGAVVPPPPPVGTISPLGYLSNRAPGYFPATNIDKYGVVSSEGPAPAAFKGVNLVYRSVISCLAGYTNMTDTECLQNGWQMIGTNGQVMRNLSYGGAVLGDPGHPGYQRRWLDKTLSYMSQHQADSFWGDDFTARVADFNGGIWPAKYPNMQAYQDGALIPFAKFVKTELAALGIQLPAYNAGVSLDDNASLTAAWWANLGPHVGHLSSEYWLHAAGHVRRELAAWDHNWSGWRALHKVCLDAGCGFLPFPSSVGQVYILASFLLDWNGKSSCMWTPTGIGGGEYNSTTDPWIPEYAVAATLDPAAPPATKSGNVWSRFNGRVKVDPVAGTASIA